MWKNQKFTIVGVGYKDNAIAYKITESTQQPIVNVSFSLENKDLPSFKNDIRQFTRSYNKENKIVTDLQYQLFFYAEKKRKSREYEERLFKIRLRSIINAYCQDSVSDRMDNVIEISGK